MTRAFVIALTIAACASVARDSAAQTGSIAGRIIDEDNKPVARAAVRLSGPGLTPASVVHTDPAGAFRFTAVPAGQFTLTASKSTYLTLAYGQARPGRGGGLPIAVTDGQQITGLAWMLPRGGAISGRVLDHRGQPMRDVPIVLMEYRTVDERRSLETVTCCVWPSTESDGTYRVYGVLPGEYLVSALPPGDYRFVPTGPWASAEPMVDSSEAEVRWARQQIGGSSVTPSAVPAAEPPRGRAVAYSRVFYPGTIDETGATAVTLKTGEERRGIDFSMRLHPVARVAGQIIGPDGQPVANPRLSRGGATVSGATVALSYANLLPGRHTITARTAVPPLWGSIDLDVNGVDLLDVVLRLEPSPSIAGRIVFEGTSIAAPDVAAVRIAVRPISAGSVPTVVAADGSFKMPLIDPGRYKMVATLTGANAPAGWTVKSVMLGGRDVADQAFDLRPGEQVTDVVVTFTDRVTDLSGTLFDAIGRPAPGFFVVVFPVNDALWSPGSRRMPAPVRAATNGRFSFASLPPGAYYLVAMSDVDQADLADPVFLKQLSTGAIQLSLIEGERKTVDLKVGR